MSKYAKSPVKHAEMNKLAIKEILTKATLIHTKCSCKTGAQEDQRGNVSFWGGFLCLSVCSGITNRADYHNSRL